MITEKRTLTLFLLVLAGESIFLLPFVLPRIFRHVMLEHYAITNLELGSFFSLYGIIAMVAYITGGALADRFQARNLMSLALILTGAGGMVLNFSNSGNMLYFVYGLWGFTTIFLFWAPLIRMTREWGGRQEQGKAFGLLEGGRGAIAAVLGTLSFLLYLKSGTGSAAIIGGGNFSLVTGIVSIYVIGVGILIRFLLPKGTYAEEKVLRWGNIKLLVGNRNIWLLALIIVSAYSGYKITDDFSLYAFEVLDMDEMSAAGVGTGLIWIRAVVSFSVAFISDRYNKQKLLIIAFLLTAVGGLLVITGATVEFISMALLNLGFIGVGIYALRSLYFAVLKEANVVFAFTGTAVGLISFIGYTPEIFIGPLMGIFLDNNDPRTGHNLVFLVLMGFSLMGALLGWLFLRRRVEK